MTRWWMLLVAGALLCAAAAAAAADLPWTGKPYQIVANEKPLPDLLRELSASQGTTAVIDPKIAGSISGRFSGSPLKTLNSLCATYGLSWYYDGAFLYVDPSADARSEVLSIGSQAGNAGWLVQSLTQLRIYDPRYPLLVSGRDGTARVTGPKRYVEMVRQVARLLDSRSALNDGAEIRLFPLKYAWAGDFKITRSGKEVAVPGIAATLRGLYGHAGGGSSTGNATAAMGRQYAAYQAGADRQLRLSTGDVVNAPMVRLPGLGAAEQGDDADAATSAGASGLSADNRQLPQFQADTRLNAVLVRDIPGHMAQYEKLIAAMDVRPRLVEIEVTIMDVSTDTLDSLGVDWRAHSSHVDFQTGNGGNSPLTLGGATSESGQTGGLCCTNSQGLPTTPLGSIFTAAIGNTLRDYLLARVSALAQTGNADVVARPKVLTLDNNEANLENLSDFYVSVAGFQDASLFKVTTGTSVRVTPMIVDERNGRGVMMTIDIQDGNIDATQSVGQIPIVRHRTVNTQALIDEGSSLLLAGYTSESRSSAASGVPVLSSIPLIGHLFKYDQKQRNKEERLYLLTPRLVTAGAAGNPTGLVPLPVQDGPAAAPAATGAASTASTGGRS
ncbi:MAG: type III secretion system outer membrane ring subunit SctC [Burkholderiales bacterium]|nr:type III secretion system outer membrane ring subunit SctC [Burkholderiales bacterium]